MPTAMIQVGNAQEEYEVLRLLHNKGYKWSSGKPLLEGRELSLFPLNNNAVRGALLLIDSGHISFCGVGYMSYFPNTTKEGIEDLKSFRDSNPTTMVVRGAKELDGLANECGLYLGIVEDRLEIVNEKGGVAISTTPYGVLDWAKMVGFKFEVLIRKASEIEEEICSIGNYVYSEVNNCSLQIYNKSECASKCVKLRENERLYNNIGTIYLTKEQAQNYKDELESSILFYRGWV